jgi:hypothetical protein
MDSRFQSSEDWTAVVGSLFVAFSFAPSGLNRSPLAPTACAVGCILSPLRGLGLDVQNMLSC